MPRKVQAYDLSAIFLEPISRADQTIDYLGRDYAGFAVHGKIFFDPSRFREYGHFRASAVDTLVAQPIQYAGQMACAECHPEVVTTKGAGYYKTVSCEVCHDPAAVQRKFAGDLHRDLVSLQNRRHRRQCDCRVVERETVELENRTPRAENRVDAQRLSRLGVRDYSVRFVSCRTEKLREPVVARRRGVLFFDELAFKKPKVSLDGDLDALSCGDLRFCDGHGTARSRVSHSIIYSAGRGIAGDLFALCALAENSFAKLRMKIDNIPNFRKPAG